MWGIEHPYRAYIFDRAVASFGRSLDAALDAVDGKNQKSINTKRGRVLDKWLGTEPKYRSPVGPTADPAAQEVEQTFTVRGA